jgi:capsular polysaccharide biosynthesis protein
LIESAAEFAEACGPDARLLEGPPPLPNADPRPARHLDPQPHPTFEHLREPRPLRGLCAGVFPGAHLETGQGLVVAPDGSVLGASAWDSEQLLKSGVLERESRSRPRVAGSQALIVSQFGGYFHWLTEALPRIAVLRRLGLGDVGLIVSRGLTLVQRESLELLGVEQWLPYEEGLAPDTLVWPRPAGHTGHPPRWASIWLREELLGPNAPQAEARLYVTRRDAPSRRVVNEAGVMKMLRREGFEVVQPERMTLREQAELFAHAAVVVGPHGAGNANVLFSRDATLVEFFEPGYVNGCMYSLCQALGHSYWYMLCECEAKADIRVPLDRLERVLESALRRAESDERR